MNKLLAMYKCDYKNITKDPMLIYSIVILPIIMIIFRLFRDQIPTEQLYAVAVLFTMALGPIIFGMLPSFIFLDEKDSKVLDAISVLPISRSSFILYRMVNGFLLVLVYSLAAPFVMDFSGIPMNALILCAFLLAFETPIVAFIIMTYAENKVEGVVAVKIINAIFLTPFLAYVISPKWSDILLPVPSYWPIKAFMESYLGNEFMMYILVGVVYYAGIISVLGWLFQRKIP